MCHPGVILVETAVVRYNHLTQDVEEVQEHKMEEHQELGQNGPD